MTGGSQVVVRTPGGGSAIPIVIEPGAQVVLRTPGPQGETGPPGPTGPTGPIAETLAHASSHAAAGSDPITPLAIGARAENRVTFSNEAHVLAATTRYLAQVGTMSASRTVTLPAASAVPAGAEVIVADQSGTVTTTNTITVQRAGSDTINGGTSAVIGQAYGWRRFLSDGVSAWVFDGGVLRGSNNLSDVASAATALGNLGGSIGAQVTKAGRWIGPGGALATLLLPADQMWCALIRVDKGITVDRIGLEITTPGSAGSVIRLGILRLDADGHGLTRVLDAGTIDGTQAAGHYAISISQALTPGIYALGAASQGGPSTRPTVRRIDYGPLGGLISAAAQASLANNPSGLFVPSVAGAIASYYSTADRASNGVNIGLRIA